MDDEEDVVAVKAHFTRLAVGATGGVVHYHFAPSKARWEEGLALFECGAVNTIEWESGLPLPSPPAADSSRHRPWLLACSDVAGVSIAKHRDGLRALGWRVLACEPEIVAELGDKCSLIERARELGLHKHLPRSYASLEAASYPCILKAARGEYGRTVHIVASASHARKLLRSHAAGFGAGSRYVLQELVRGRVEHSLSLLVEEGRVLRALHTRYEYSAAEYVWPRVHEVARSSTDAPPPAHLAVLQPLIGSYSGFCNVNYKTRAAEEGAPSTEDGSALRACALRGEDLGMPFGEGEPMGEPDTVLAIFEMNMRVGGDLINDAPKSAARSFLEGLEETAAAAL